LLNSAAMFVEATPLDPWHCAPAPVPQVFSSAAFNNTVVPGAECGLWQLSHPLVATVV
jgi:hypothetical protein